MDYFVLINYKMQGNRQVTCLKVSPSTKSDNKVLGFYATNVKIVISYLQLVQKLNIYKQLDDVPITPTVGKYRYPLE